MREIDPCECITSASERVVIREDVTAGKKESWGAVILCSIIYIIVTLLCFFFFVWLFPDSTSEKIPYLNVPPIWILVLALFFVCLMSSLLLSWLYFDHPHCLHSDNLLLRPCNFLLLSSFFPLSPSLL